MANELQLGEIMGYRGDPIAQLGRDNFLPNLSITEDTKQAMSAFVDWQQKKKEKEFQDFHNNLVNSIANIKKTDGVFDGDRDLINQKQKEVIQLAIDSPAAYKTDALLKNPQAYQKQVESQMEFAQLVDKSKAYKVTFDEVRKKISTDNDFNNDYNISRLETEQKKPIDERDITNIIPISSGDKDLQTFENAFYKNASQREKVQEVNSVDPASVDTVWYGYYMFDEYMEGFRDVKGEYLTRKWETDKSIQQKFPDGPEAYITSEAQERFRSKKELGRDMKSNASIIEQGKTERANILAKNRLDVIEKKEEDSGTAKKYPQVYGAVKKFNGINSEFDANEKSTTQIPGYSGNVSVTDSYKDYGEKLKTEVESVVIPLSEWDEKKMEWMPVNDPTTGSRVNVRANSLIRFDGGNQRKYVPAHKLENGMYLYDSPNNKASGGKVFSEKQVFNMVLGEDGNNERSKLQTDGYEVEDLFNVDWYAPKREVSQKKKSGGAPPQPERKKKKKSAKSYGL